MATIYLKDFPDQLHRESKSQAALMGVSMKELIIRALTEYLKAGKLPEWEVPGMLTKYYTTTSALEKAKGK